MKHETRGRTVQQVLFQHPTDDVSALNAESDDAILSSFDDQPVGHTEQQLAAVWCELLQVDRVGRQDNFFELGGDSLLIMHMMERLRAQGLATEVRHVFEAGSLAALASVTGTAEVSTPAAPCGLIPHDCTQITPDMVPLAALERSTLDHLVATVQGGAANIQDLYPLAPLQERMLFHHLLGGEGGDAYVASTLLRMPSWRRLEDLIAALQCVIDRHDALRTAMRWQDLPRPIQVVHRRVRLPVEEVRWQAGDEDTSVAWMNPARQRMDLQQAPLIRLRIAAEPNSNAWLALIQMHHIVIDDISQERVISEVVDQLHGRVFAATSVPYGVHVAETLAFAASGRAETFWRGQFGDVEEPTAPFDVTDTQGDGSRLAECSESLPAELAQRLRALARARSMSAATLFHAAFGLVVAATTSRSDIVYGTVLLGRLQGTAGAQHGVGMFINTLPLRLRLQGLTADRYVDQTHQALLNLLSHEQSSLAQAQQASSIAGDLPLFTALFNYRHRARGARAKWSDAEGIEVLARCDQTHYPITVSIDDLGEPFILSVQTDCSIEPARVLGYLTCAVQSLVWALEQAAPLPVLALPVLPAAERARIESFNATRVSYPTGRTIHALFEDQVLRTPQASAVLHGGQSLSYAQLNARANQLARHLRDQGIGPGERVGLCVERSIEMVIGLLGVLKAGAAYVPLDPHYPVERLQAMLEDALPPVVLTQSSVMQRLPASDSMVIALDALLPRLSGNDAANLRAEAGAEDALLYVIYTSGSTGRPKGIAMPHAAMANLMEWHREVLPCRTEERVLQCAALSFDVAFQETFSTLCTGGTLVLLDEWVRRDPRALLALLRDQRIERLFVPPMLLQGLAECATAEESPNSLKDVITAGEQLRVSAEIVAFMAGLPGARLHNHYGPTETHVVTALTLSGDPRQWPAFPAIGRPIANTRIHLLDARGRPVPIGVVGELFIAGANVARGYLNQPEGAAERFQHDPFSADPQARRYRTGDLGRWRDDGTIEYVGRNDEQVKIRGYRIELGEVEAVLARHPQVREAAVVVCEEASVGKRLVAYVSARDASATTQLSAEVLRAHVAGALPEHMMPSAFVVLERLPLTPSGKLNRRALPAPDFSATLAGQYEPPQGATELALAEVWRELLHVERVGRHDNFFELGGHSLLAMRVVAHLHAELSIDVPVRWLFEYPTVQRFAVQVGVLRVAHAMGSDRTSSSSDELLQALASMPEHQAEALLNELAMEARS